MTKEYSSITFHEADRDSGPFMILISGKSEFVSNIRIGYYSRWGYPSASVTLVEGWTNPEIKTYRTLDEALEAAEQVWDIEGFHTSIETVE